MKISHNGYFHRKRRSLFVSSKEAKSFYSEINKQVSEALLFFRKKQSKTENPLGFESPLLKKQKNIP